MCLQYIDIKQKKLKQFYHNPRVGGSSPSSATILSLENLSLSLNHSFCRLLTMNMILWPKLALCHFKSDPRVTEEWQETSVSSDFCLDGAIGLS